jgi:hypothetical protein
MLCSLTQRSSVGLPTWNFQAQLIHPMNKKSLLLVVLLVFVTNLSFAQIRWPGAFLRSMIGNYNVYKTRHPLPLERIYDVNSNRAIIDTAVVYMLTPTPDNFLRYKIMKEEDAFFYIRVLPQVAYTSTSVPDTVLVRYTKTAPPDNANPNSYYFKVATAGLLPHQKYLATERIMGMPITLPVKFRREDGNLRGEFELSIGYAFGYRIRTNNNPYKENYINVIPYGFSFNADKYKPVDAGDDFEAIDSFSLTYWTSGVTYEIRKFNIGFFIGRDRMFNDRSDWVYQNKTWYSIGLGYKFGSEE